MTKPIAEAVRVLGLALTAGVGPALTPLAAQQPGIRRIELQRHDLSVTGREVVQARIEIDSGGSFPRHSHPGEEIIYVLEGTLRYQIDGREPVTLHAGLAYFIPARAIHSATNVGAGTAVELATYVVEQGEPLVVVAH